MNTSKIEKESFDDEDDDDDFEDADFDEEEYYDWYEDYEEHPLLNAYETACDELGVWPEGSVQGHFGIIFYLDELDETKYKVDFEDEIEFMNSLDHTDDERINIDKIKAFISSHKVIDECAKSLKEDSHLLNSYYTVEADDEIKIFDNNLNEDTHLVNSYYMIEADDEAKGANLTKAEARELTKQLKETATDYIHVVRTSVCDTDFGRETQYEDIVEVTKKDSRWIIRKDDFNIFENDLKEGRSDIYHQIEDEYFQALQKAQDNGSVTFIVGKDTEQEDEFDTFEDAVEYAKQIGEDKVFVSEFAICYGYYCDGEYDEYEERILDLDKNILEDLMQSSSEEAFKKNVETEIEAGKDPKQAVAIAYAVKDKNLKENFNDDLVKQLIDDRYFEDGEILNIEYIDDLDPYIIIETKDGKKAYEYIGGRLFDHISEAKHDHDALIKDQDLFSVEQVKDLAMEYYDQGGSVIIETWSDQDILEWLNQHGSKEELLSLFSMYKDQYDDMKGSGEYKDLEVAYSSDAEQKEDDSYREVIYNVWYDIDQEDYLEGVLPYQYSYKDAIQAARLNLDPDETIEIEEETRYYRTFADKEINDFEKRTFKTLYHGLVRNLVNEE